MGSMKWENQGNFQGKAQYGKKNACEMGEIRKN